MDIDWLLRDMQNLSLIMSLGTPHELYLFIDRNSRLSRLNIEIKNTSINLFLEVKLIFNKIMVIWQWILAEKYNNVKHHSTLFETYKRTVL